MRITLRDAELADELVSKSIARLVAHRRWSGTFVLEHDGEQMGMVQEAVQQFYASSRRTVTRHFGSAKRSSNVVATSEDLMRALTGAGG